MKSKLGIALSWILVFLLGAVAGAVSHSIYRERIEPAAVTVTPPKRESIVDGMAREFKLDAQQKESLKSIFAQSIQRYRTLGQQYRPQWETIRKETDEQIKQMLRPDQRSKYEEFLKKAYSPPPGLAPAQTYSQQASIKQDLEALRAGAAGGIVRQGISASPFSDASNREHRNSQGTSIFQRPGSAGNGSPGGHHIIDQENAFLGNRSGPRANKCLANIFLPLKIRQSHLWKCRPDALKRRVIRKSNFMCQGPGKKFCLVISPLTLPLRMKRDRDHHIKIPAVPIVEKGSRKQRGQKPD